MKELSAGVVGMGVMGMLHTGILNSLENVKVTAMADTEKFVIGFLQKSLSNVKIYDDYKKMLSESNLDLLFITTPVNSHIKIASDCIKNNIPFFIEKPLGLNASECESLCKLLSTNNVINMTGFYLRFADTFCKAKELLDDGIIGGILKINAHVSRPLILKKNTGWRFKKEISGGGVLIDIGISLVDLLLWYFGNIKSVQGTYETNFLPEIEDFVSAKLTFEAGFECNFESTWNVKNQRLQETNIEIVGENGSLKVNEDYVNLKLNKTNDEQLFYKPTLYNGVSFDIGGPMYTREDVDFVNCIRSGKQSMLNALNILKTQSVIESIYKSCKSHKTEQVSYID